MENVGEPAKAAAEAREIRIISLREATNRETRFFFGQIQN